MEGASGVMMDKDQQPGLIAGHVAKTLQSFRNFKGALSEGGAPLNDFPVQIENDLTRFKMWVGNQAAHQIGSASLDYRLREAAHLQQQVIYLLKDIYESLQAATSLFRDTSPPPERNQEDGNNEIFQVDDSSSLWSREDDESDILNEWPTSSLHALSTDIREAVDCLLSLSVAIANPAPHERFRKLGAGPAEDLSFYEPHDIAYVSDKFPSITTEMADALGKLITRRRQFFKYRHAHHERLASGIESVFSDKETETWHTELISKTVASSLPEEFKELTDLGPHTFVIDEDTRSDAGMSRTSYATSAGLTFADTDQAASTLRVPPLPKATENGIFECPFCYRMIAAKTRMAWKRHVFGDLRPYTCVFPKCIGSNVDFDCRRDWQLHVSKYHWRSWSCPFKCQEPFSAEAELSRHIREYHLPTGTEEELKSITALGERAAPHDISSPCLLCGYSVQGLKRYIKHVGWHLEQLALFALPNLEREVLVGEARDNEKSSSGPEVDEDNPQSFFAIPSPISEAHPGLSLQLPIKGLETLSSDDIIKILSSELSRRQREERRMLRNRIAELSDRIASHSLAPALAPSEGPSSENPVDQMHRLSFEKDRHDDKARRLLARIQEKMEEEQVHERLRERHNRFQSKQ